MSVVRRSCSLQLRSLRCLQQTVASVEIAYIVQEACLLTLDLSGAANQRRLSRPLGLFSLRDDSERPWLRQLQLRNDRLRGHGASEDAALDHVSQRFFGHGVLLVGR